MSTTLSRPRATRVVDTIGVLAVVVGLLLGLVPGIALPAADAAHGSGALGAGDFEIDGDIAVNDGGHDWSDIATYADGGEMAADGVENKPAQTDTTWFKGSMVESTYPDWEFVSGGNAAKSDLHRLFVASQVAGADSFLWLGASRMADNGSTQVTVEFNQDDNSFVDLAGGYRIQGDFYLTFNFPGRPTGNTAPDVITVKVGSWPTGRIAGAYPTEIALDVDDFRYAIGGIADPDAYEFLELEIELSAIFGPGGVGAACAQFGSVSFRTESSGGGGGGTDESTLKDVAGPFPIDLDTCADVEVEKVDAEGNPLNGAVFSAYLGHDAPALGIPYKTCTTGPDATDVGGADTEDDGACSFGPMLPGNYTLHETGVPDGYAASPDLPVNFTVLENTPLDLGPYEDPRIDYTIAVAPDGRNAVGNAHTFTVTLTDDAGAPVADADLDLTWSGAAAEVSSVTPAGPDADTLDCTTDANGQCTVVVLSTSVGEETLSASWTTPYQHASGDGGPSTDGEAVASISDGADKTWVGYVASIEESATNLVSNGDTAGQHVFTATVKEDDGSGTLTAASGVDVTVSWTGAPTGASISPVGLDCTTDASGQCTFTVDSPTAGAGTITIVGLDGTILGLDDTTDDDEDLVYDAAIPGSEPVAEAEKSLTATKTWREYRALIDGDATNPVGQSHTFNVQVQYREDDGADSWTDAAIAGLTVASTSTGVGTVDEAASTCDNGTDATGHCTIVVDTDPDEPGSRGVSLTSVTGDLLPGDEPNVTTLTYAFDDTQYDTDEGEFRTTTKTWIEFGANIVSDGHNLVSTDGQPLLGLHEFTVTVWRRPAPGADATAVPAGTRVTTSIDWASDFPEPAGLVYDNSCLDDGTISVEFDGSLYSQCTITLNSTVPGVATVTPTGLVGYDYGDGAGSQGVTFAAENVDSAVKTWYRYRAWIDADSTNLAGDPEGDHDFTVTVEQDSGAGWGPVPNATTVTVTSPDGDNDGTLDDASCDTTTTAGVSTCTIGVSSLDPGSRTVTVGTVEALAVDGDPTVDVSGGDHLDLEDATQRTSATKTWVSYSAAISADATNLTGQEHVFTVTAFVDSGDGPVAAPVGTTLTIDVDADFLVDNTCDDGTGDQTNPDTGEAAASNECFVTVDSDDVDEVTVTVTHATPVSGSVDGDPTDDITDVDATKTWIEVLVDVEADATNIVGEPHTFTIDVDLNTPGGLAEPDSGTVVATTSGVGQEDSQSCDTGLEADGTCSVVVSSDESGDRVVTADSISFTYDGTTFSDVDLDGAVGVASASDLTATKTWRAYRVDIEADGLNAVRDPHTFTVTIEQTDVADPGDDDWSEVPDNTTATVGISNGGPGTITSNDCAAPGTVGGTCSVVLASDDAGSTVVTVSAISVAHPTTEAATAVDVANDAATKTWIAFRGSIVDDALNVTGDDHTFHVDVEYTTDGETWTQVPDGSTVAVSDDSADPDSVGAIDATTCDSTEAAAASGDTPAHICTVTVDSADSGQLTVTVDGVSTEDITANGITTTFDVTFASGEDGVLDGFTAGDYAATKTWAAYTLSLDPVDAVNLLNGLDDDAERYHTITATLGSDSPDDAPVGGQSIDVTISGSTGEIVAVDSNGAVDVDDPSTFEGTVAPDGLSATCTTADDGTCDIVIFSSATGVAEVNASYEATVGESEAVIVEADTDLETEGVQGATKTWTTYRVTVTPAQAVNLVGNPHVFTVLVERSDEDGEWLPVVGAFPEVDLTAPTATILTDTCETDGTVVDDPGTEDVDEAGTCLVTVDSDNVEAVTLTATYEASLGQVVAAFSDSGDKDWIDYELTVTPETAENLVDTDHVFTVKVTTTFPSLDEDQLPTTTTAPVEGAVPGISLGLGDVGSIVDNDCVAGTDDQGECTVTIRSSAPGSTTLTATYLGTAADDTELREYSDSGAKLWVNYALVIDPDLANNTVGDPHTFTATLTVDSGQGFGPAVGQALQFTVDGVGEVTGGDVDEALACVTDDAGECDITINSTEAGTTDVAVSYGAVVGETSRTFGPVVGTKNWVDIDLVKTAVVGDGFTDGDLVADPDTGLPTLFFTSSDRGPKTAVFEYTITNTGPVALQDVVLTDDRLGTVIALGDGVTLEPGASTTVRANEQFSYEDAAGGLDSIIVNVGVVTANDGEGNDVSDTDDAAIQLIAQQSSILIDLEKEVVGGVGDVTVEDGFPTVTWSQAELEAGATKTVRYRFTITNIGPSPIVDVELLDDMVSDQPLIAVADGVTLQPGESTTVEVDHVLTAGEAFPDGPTAGELPNVASVSGANETRDAFDQDSDDAVVFVQVVFDAPPIEREPPASAPLPVTGLDSGLLPVSVLLITVGAAVLWLDRRRWANG